MTHGLDLCPAPARRGERGGMVLGRRQYGDDMIGPAGTVGLHVTSTQRLRVRERQQWGGREGASTALFDNGWMLCPHPFQAFSRHALLI